jgi:NAD(P)-dependent dehydrogenase (short-subunit alcohol dehydrogenase family)
MTEPRVAIVSGGSRGLGAGIVHAFLEAGYRVATCARTATPQVEQWASDPATADRFLFATADLANRADVDAFVTAVIERWGTVDVLVNNAGVAPDVRADILEAGEESFDRLIKINLRGPYFLTQTVARTMIEQRQSDPAFKGVIVNVSSVSATVASVNRGDYCISKAGVAMATQLWAARLAEFGVDVYEVRPGVVATDMTSGVKEKYDKLIAEGLTVEKRWGTPDDVGRAVAILARGELPYATGQVLNIDGGMTVQRL